MAQSRSSLKGTLAQLASSLRMVPVADHVLWSLAGEALRCVGAAVANRLLGGSRPLEPAPSARCPECPACRLEAPEFSLPFVLVVILFFGGLGCFLAGILIGYCCRRPAKRIARRVDDRAVIFNAGTRRRGASSRVV